MTCVLVNVLSGSNHYFKVRIYEENLMQSTINTHIFDANISNNISWNEVHSMKMVHN